MSLPPHPDDLADWRYEVANGDTMRGFYAWVEHKDAEIEASPALMRAVEAREARRAAHPGHGWTTGNGRFGLASVITPGGHRVAWMTRARAHGITAALNTDEGHAAFMRGRQIHLPPEECR